MGITNNAAKDLRAAGRVITMEEKKVSERKSFFTIMVALVLVVASTGYFVYKYMSTKAYEERWKDYDECGMV
ncbi:MAG: hypothetical protein QM689_04195 [Oscillospiraceae bacterium]